MADLIMEKRQQNVAAHLVPSLTDLAFLVPLVFLFLEMKGARTLLGDGDTGWHVRTGEWILAHGSVPRQDLFSFTMPGQPWFAWEWLWDVAAAWLHRLGGMAAVVLASAVVIALTFAALYRITRERCGNPLVAIGVTLLAAAASSVHWLARPHLVTGLMVVVFYGILSGLPKRGERARRRIAYLLLPGLTVLWTNLHGGFVAGIGMMVVFGVAEWAPALWSTDARQSGERWRLARLYLGGAAACLAASLMNPYFYHLHAHILQYLNDPYQFDHISEFLSLSFHHPAARYLEPMLLLSAVAAYRQVRRGRLADALILVGWGHLALVSARHIPLFVALAAPAVAAMLAEWQEAWTHAPVAPWVAKAARRMQMLAQETEYHEMPWRAHLVSAAALLALAAGLYAPAPAVNFRSDYDPAIYPAKAVVHLAALPDSGRVFTHDEWGDYLIYRLYPRTKVFLDGRSDFYGRTFGEKYLDVMNVKRGWEAILARYSIDTILLPPDAPLAGALKESPRWRIDYDDGVALVFRAAPRDPAGNSQVSTACKGDGEARGRETARTTM